MESKEIVVGFGEKQRVNLGFLGLAVRVSNPSAGFLKLAGQFVVPAGSYGGILPLVPGSNTWDIELSSTDPAGNVLVDNHQSCILTFYSVALQGQAPAVQTVSLQTIPSNVVAAQGAAGATAWPVSLPASTHGKLRDLQAAVTNLKAAAGVLHGVQVVNASAAAAFVQIFDALAANVVLGTTTPDKEIEVAAGATVYLPLPAGGVTFGNAISAAATTAEKGSIGSAAGVEVFFDYE